MKKRITLLSGLLGGIIILTLSTSCRKVEREPKDWFGAALVFDTLDRNGTVAAFNLNDLYTYLPTGFDRINGDFLDAATDDAVPSRNGTFVEYYTNGRINVLNNPDPYFGNSYNGIRRANIFLANINSVPLSLFVNGVYVPDSLTKRYWRAEARFIRTMLYFELVKRYGGVPLVGDRIFSINDDLQIPRNTYAECVNYIVSECNAVKDSLRREADISDGIWGRIPRGAAIALKNRMLLYAASPLFNDPAGAVNPLVGYPSYSASRWQLAADAAKELLDLNAYSLYTTSATNFPAFAGLFTQKRNAEIILQKQAGNSTSLEGSQAPVGYGAPAASQGLTSPTQNFVDAFPMLNGLGISEAGSGYSATAPYTGRDPRLAASVFFNGTRWLNDTVRTFEGGKDKPSVSTVAVQTKTGYYLRKFLGNFANGTTYSNTSHNYNIFRLGEIILNYAEALNELGQTEGAVAQVIRIRQRAGLTAGTSSRYGIKANITQAELRTLIQNERRIELAFEEHRFWDVRRWKIAPQVLNGPLTGMQIVRTGTNAFTYTPFTVTTISFQNRLYLMPLPYDETTRNRALIQNEGW